MSDQISDQDLIPATRAIAEIFCHVNLDEAVDLYLSENGNASYVARVAIEAYLKAQADKPSEINELRAIIKRLKMPMNFFDADQFLAAMDHVENGETKRERLIVVMLQYITHKAARG